MEAPTSRHGSSTPEGGAAAGQAAVEVQGVAKRFCRSLRRAQRYGLLDIANELLGRDGHAAALRPDEFWAVDDVSFALRRGECLGVIGRNGAGKSTLLRLINGILRPDRGRIVVRGRVGALIDLSAGLNPVLSGRENIQVGGALLGIDSARLARLLPEIVGFAELEEFVDMPVQSYSSGMRARLGFALAAHLEPDVMLVDEVLAVGDFEFRRRCFARLNEMKRRGTAFLLVSHSMSNILQFAERALWLDRGRVTGLGPADEVCRAYLASDREAGRSAALNPTTANERLARCEVGFWVDGALQASHRLRQGEHASLRFHFESRAPLSNPHVAFPVHSRDGTMLTSVASLPQGVRFPAPGKVFAGEVRFGPVNLNPGSYVVVACLQDGPEHLCRAEAAELHVDNGGVLTYGTVSFGQEWSVRG